MNDAEAEEEVNRIMAQVDKNNSGAIDYSGISSSLDYRICNGNYRSLEFAK